MNAGPAVLLLENYANRFWEPDPKHSRSQACFEDFNPFDDALQSDVAKMSDVYYLLFKIVLQDAFGADISKLTDDEVCPGAMRGPRVVALKRSDGRAVSP